MGSSMSESIMCTDVCSTCNEVLCSNSCEELTSLNDFTPYKQKESIINSAHNSDQNINNMIIEEKDTTRLIPGGGDRYFIK